MDKVILSLIKEYGEYFIPIYCFRSVAELSGPEGAEQVDPEPIDVVQGQWAQGRC